MNKAIPIQVKRPFQKTLKLQKAGLCSLLLMTYSCASTAANIVRGPYVQIGTDSSMTVRWDTDSATTSQVKFGDAVNALSQSVTDSTPKTQHIVTLNGLSPLTRYYYSVGSTTATLAGNDAQTFFKTSPTPGQATNTRIWVVGDPGRAGTNPTTQDQQYVLNGFNTFSNNQSPDFWLMLGDNAYDDGTVEQYQNAVFDQYPTLLKQSVLWPAMGNHDNRTAKVETQTGGYYDLFSMPTNGEAGGEPSGHEAYFSFDYGNIHVVVLNSSDDEHNLLSGPMDEWLQNDLSGTSADWIIAIFHHAPYGKSGHDSDSENELIRMRENFLPILEKNGVDLVMAGHNHFYTRSTLITNHYGYSNTYLENIHNLDAGDGRADGNGVYSKTARSPYAGTVYITHGAGSGGGESSASKVSQTQIDDGSRHPTDFMYGGRGSMVLDIDGANLKVNVISPVGTVIDHFTISHDNSDTNLLPVANANGDYQGSPNASVSFSSAGSQDPDGTISNYLWDFGDGNTSTVANPSHTYTTVGEFNVSLLVIDNGGARSSDSVIATIINAPATSVEDACATENATTSGETITPYDPICIDSSGSATSYVVRDSEDFTNMAINTGRGSGDLSLYVKQGGWPKTDGSDPHSVKVSNSECVFFTSPTSEHYTYIKVVGEFEGAALVVDTDVQDCRGNGQTGNQNPTANVNGPYVANEDQNIQFDSSGSADAEGPIAAYLWDFGDGNSSTSANPTHSYTNAQIYPVKLTVTDSEGLAATSETTATITAPANDQLQNGVSQTVSGTQGQQTFYSMTVPASATELLFTISGGTGDADLYVRYDTLPTQADYDCRPYKGGNSESCPIANVQQGTYHVMLRGYNDYSGVSLTGSYTEAPTSATMPDACATDTPITGGRLTDGEVKCLADDDTIWLSVGDVNDQSSVAISTGNGIGDLSIEYSNQGWPSGGNVDASSDLGGNTECIIVTEQANHWGYIKVSGSSGGASIVVDFNSEGCR